MNLVLRFLLPLLIALGDASGARVSGIRSTATPPTDPYGSRMVWIDWWLDKRGKRAIWLEYSERNDTHGTALCAGFNYIAGIEVAVVCICDPPWVDLVWAKEEPDDTP